MNVDVKTYDRNLFKNIKGGDTFCYMKGGLIMEVDVNVKTNREIKFSNLKQGDTFSFQDNMWMKLEETLKDQDGYYVNAISLEFGSGAEFNDNDKIIFVKTRLVDA